MDKETLQSKISALVLEYEKSNPDIQHLLKAERNKALLEAIDICEAFIPDIEKKLNEEKKEGNFTTFGQLNLMLSYVQKLKAKMIK